MQVSELLAGIIAEQGSSVLFGVLGDSNLYVVEAFQGVEDHRFVAATHEQETVLMAAGYAAASSTVGVATVTHGAITNCVTALCDVVRGGYPVVVLAGETSPSEEYNLQRLPQAEIVRATGAEYISLTNPRTLAKDVRRAFATAGANDSTVVVGIPSGFQRMEVEQDPTPVTEWFRGGHEPDEDGIEAAAGLLLGSNHPVLVLGRGCAGSPEAEELAAELATFLGAPICTTLRGQGLVGDAGFNVGIMGTLSNPITSEVLAASDCLVVFGASLNHLTTMKGELLAGKRVIQFDGRAEAFGRYFPVDIAVTCDVALGMRALLRVLRSASDPYQGSRLEALGERLAIWRRDERRSRPKDTSLDIRQALHRIDDITPRERFLSVDIGRFGHQALNRVGVTEAGRFVHAGNIAQIGLSVGYGTGAALGSGGRPCVVVAGDGGFMLGGIGPYNTAVRHSADLIVFVMNDRAYGAEYYRLAEEDLNAPLAEFGWPSFDELAVALGGDGMTVRTLQDFDEVAEGIKKRTKPLLIDVILDPRSVPDPGLH